MGTWDLVLVELRGQAHAVADLEEVGSLDSTVARAHQTPPVYPRPELCRHMAARLSGEPRALRPQPASTINGPVAPAVHANGVIAGHIEYPLGTAHPADDAGNWREKLNAPCFDRALTTARPGSLSSGCSRLGRPDRSSPNLLRPGKAGVSLGGSATTGDSNP